MAVTLDKRKRVSSDLKSWLDDVSQYERTFEKWEKRGELVMRRYRDERRQTQVGLQEARYNILWSNTQTLLQAVYSRMPQPDVTRRFRDNDPVGRVAALILERALDFEIQHYGDFRSSLREAIQDRFLPGRGIVWLRYEPHIGPNDDIEITEDEEDETYEELKNECSPVDYVHWRDFGHSVARTWEEVNRVWRKVYMTKRQLRERFGKQKAAMVPMDAMPEEFKKRQDFNIRQERACIYEGWDKDEGNVVWFSKGVKDFLDERDDPLSLENFFPCPKPLYATVTTDSLEPIPDYTQYQDQARELDILADRIDGLIKALKVTGVYDASQGNTLARLFTEGDNNNLLPVKNWAAFAEKNGLAGAIDVVDLSPIAGALEQAYLAFQNIKAEVDGITGIADIIRGQSAATETATAVVTKGQYASLRLRGMQEEVARFATEIIRMKAEIICGKYSDDTLVRISGAMQLQPVDQQLIGPALQMLRNEPNRDFRIEIAADTLVQIDEEAEKRSAVEFLTMVGNYMASAQNVVQAAPEALPLVLELLKFGVARFKVGKTVEGLFDQFVQQATQTPRQRQPDPKMIQAQAQAQTAMTKAGSEQNRAQADVAVAMQNTQAAQAKAEADIARANAQKLEAQTRALQAMHSNVVPMLPGLPVQQQ